jgi:hypothetical protein
MVIIPNQRSILVGECFLRPQQLSLQCHSSQAATQVFLAGRNVDVAFPFQAHVVVGNESQLAQPLAN